MAWVSADYYRNRYHGQAVSDEEFLRLEAAAQRYLQQAVFGRVVQAADAAAERPEAEKLPPAAATAVREGVCALIEVLLQKSGEGIQSETLGDYAVTYTQEESGASRFRRMEQTVRRCLGGTGLLYRGTGSGPAVWILPEESSQTV